jgi:putative molybdopterin biosynthesis protein
MFRRLLTLEEAKRVIIQHFKPKPPGFEKIPILKAFKRVLSEDVKAAFDVPPFTRSTVDGYAVIAEDTFKAEESRPVKLKLCGTVSVGEMPSARLTHGAAFEIMTGAPLPEGADAVVMAEYTECKNGEVYVYNPVVQGENVMKIGSDIKKGETVLRKGRVLGSREIGALAAIGMATVKVYKVPKVAVLSTGAELTEPGETLLPAKIYDINAYSLSAAVLEAGGEPIHFGVFQDDSAEVKEALKKALFSADVVLTSGGVSIGLKDVIPKTLSEIGKPGLIVCGIAIKPGKPTTVAIINGKPIFALPGHPTSALLIFHILVKPVIERMAGRKPKRPLKVKATASKRIFPAKGRRTFVTVKLKKDKDRKLTAEPATVGLSGAITTLLKADGFIEIPEDQQFIDENEEVTVHLFREPY